MSNYGTDALHVPIEVVFGEIILLGKPKNGFARSLRQRKKNGQGWKSLMAVF